MSIMRVDVDDLTCIQSKIAPTKDDNGNNQSLESDVFKGLPPDTIELVLDTNRPKPPKPESGDAGLEPDTINTGSGPTPSIIVPDGTRLEPDTSESTLTDELKNIISDEDFDEIDNCYLEAIESEETGNCNQHSTSNALGHQIGEENDDYLADDSELDNLDGVCCSIDSNPVVSNTIPDSISETSRSLLNFSEPDILNIDNTKACLKDTELNFEEDSSKDIQETLQQIIDQVADDSLITAEQLKSVPDEISIRDSTTETDRDILDAIVANSDHQLVETALETKSLASIQSSPKTSKEQDSPIFRYLLIEPDRGCYSDSEIEMGRRSLSFKSRSPRMVYTQEEFKEGYTTIDKGKSLDSAAKQDVKRGFQRMKAERAGGPPLRHTRSLSTPVAESYNARAPVRGKVRKGPRATSMVEQGTDTSEYFKDHEDDEANIRLRGIVSPNETNNNKNLDPAPLKIEVKPEMAIKPRKAEDVNGQNPGTPQSPSRSPHTNEDLTIMSGYSSDKKVGITKPIMGDISPTKQNRVSLTKHLQDNEKVDGQLNGDYGINGVWYTYNVKKTEIAMERHVMLKNAIKKGEPNEKISPQASTITESVKPQNGSSPSVEHQVDEEVSRTFRKDENSSPKLIAPKTLVYPAGPFTITTRIVDGEEEMILGNVELPPVTRPQSVPVMSSRQHYRHFACIEPVGQPLGQKQRISQMAPVSIEPVGQPVGHAPRMSQIEPVLVSQTKRPASQQLNQTIKVTPVVPNDEPTEIDTTEDSPDIDGGVKTTEANGVIPMMSVTVMASTMPELQKPEVTRVERVKDSPVRPIPQKPLVDTNANDIIMPQKELVIKSNKELITMDPIDTTDLSQTESGVNTKSTSPMPDTADSSPANSNIGRRNRFVFPSVSDGKVQLRRSSVTEADEEEEDREIYDESFRNSGWIYIGGNQELQMITGPTPNQRPPAWKQQSSKTEVIKAQVEVEKLSKKYKKSKKGKKDDDKTIVVSSTDEEDVFKREDPARESVTTTASEEEFKQQYRGVALRRIQRKQSIMDYQRLSMIAREREVIVEKENGLFGFRIQYSKPVVVTDIDQGGAAEKAGLKVGDMMLKVNGKDVTQAAHSQVVKLAAAGPDTLELLVGTNVCNTLNMEAIKPVLTGYLWKLGGSGVIRSWKKRWFVLKHDNVLYYYKTNEDAEPLGAIVLSNYTVGKSRDVGKPNAFKITKHKARTYHMYSSTAEEMNSWAKAITEAARPNSKADIWLDISAHNVSVPALSIKYPDCHGVLTKMGGKRKTWKRRYCVLKDACLYYYKDIDTPQALGVAHFHGYSIQETEIGSKKYAFIMKPPSDDLRTFYFIADHETDRKRWVAAFAYSIGRWIQTNTGEDSDEEEGNEMLI